MMIPFHIPPNNELRQIQEIRANHLREPLQHRIEGRSQRVYYTSHPEIAGQTTNQEYTVILVEEKELRLFIKKVYLFACLLILIACVTWGVTILVQFDLRKTLNVSIVIWLGIALFLALFLLVFITKNPWNTLLSLCCAIFIIIVGVCVAVHVPLQQYIIGVLLALVTLIVLCFGSAFCPEKYLPSFEFIFFLFIILAIVLIALVIVLLFSNSLILMLAILLIYFCISVVSIIFHTQYIHGRFDTVPIDNLIYYSLSIFLKFTGFLFCFLCTYNIYKKL